MWNTDVYKAVSDVLDISYNITISDIKGTVMEAFAEYYEEKVTNFDKEINEDREDTLSDFAKAIDKMLDYKDKN